MGGDVCEYRLRCLCPEPKDVPPSCHLISNGSESILILVHLYLVNRLSGPTGAAGGVCIALWCLT